MCHTAFTNRIYAEKLPEKLNYFPYEAHKVFFVKETFGKEQDMMIIILLQTYIVVFRQEEKLSEASEKALKYQAEIDRKTAHNAFIQTSGVFAELELRIIRERVRSGMANAKAKGAKIGRPHTTTEEIPQIFFRHYPAFKSGSLNLSEFARVCGPSRTTIYKYIELLEK